MRKAHSGFTLLELMLVLTIAGLLFAFAIPAMGDFLRNARITAAANDVMVGLHFTRSEAIKRRVAVTLCTSANPLVDDDPAVPTPSCTASTQLFGWIAFVDDNGDNVNDASDGNGVRDAGEIVLQQAAAMPTTITARSSANPFRVTYLLTGFAQAGNAAQIVLCDERGNVPTGGELSSARGIQVSATGRAGVTRDLSEIQSLVDLIGGTIGGCTS